MPRRRRAARALLPEVPSLSGEPGNLLADPRAERVAVFEKTKMCKFFILGACTKGSNCHFAHQKEDLKNLPDLTRTKLCKSLINTGQCDDPECQYAHTKDELRPTPVPDAIPKRQQRQLLHEMAASQRQQQQQIHQQQQPRQAPMQMQQPQQQLPPQVQGLQGFPGMVPMRQPQQPQQTQQPLQQQQQQQLGQDPRPPQQQALGANVPTAATAAGATAMPCAVPGMAFLANSQDPALVQQYSSLLQQMGQAAQAHALEAARLQAMAMQMQQGVTAQAATGAAVPANATRIMPYLMLNGGIAGFDPQTLMLPQMVQLQGQTVPAAGGMPTAAMGTPGQEFSAAPAPQMQEASLPVAPQQTSPGEDNPRMLAAAMSRVLGNEPVQIRTETLRSMSSNSLCRMVPPDEDDEYASEDEQTNLAARAQTPNGGAAAAAAEKRSQDTPLGAPLGTPQVLPQAQETRKVGHGNGNVNSSNFSKCFDKSAITIKNTFVDIASPAAANPLRSVRTAGGRLDLLGRQASGNQLDILDE